MEVILIDKKVLPINRHTFIEQEIIVSLLKHCNLCVHLLPYSGWDLFLLNSTIYWPLPRNFYTLSFIVQHTWMADYITNLQTRKVTLT